MRQKIIELWHARPLWIIFGLAIFLRIVAAIFSKGFAMYDDHFVVIEIAQRWLDSGLGELQEGDPNKRSLLYQGFHYVLFALFQDFNLTDPQAKMLVVRFIHAFYSLLVVWLGYLLTRHLSDLKTARFVGLLLAVFWILPFMSVRNLVEFVCIPPLMAGLYWLLKADAISSEQKKSKGDWYFIASGVMLAIAFLIRYQTAFFPAGVGLVLLFRKEIRPLLCLSGGFIVGVFVLNGLLEWWLWGSPVASLQQYIVYNLEHRGDFTTGPWYRYLLLMLGVFIPPISFFWIFGWLRTWREWALLFWPTFLFIFFHSLFPNKQERFILPVLPFIIILGTIGWNEFVARSAFWQRHPLLLKRCWVWFWVLNTIVLVPVTLTYSKKARVESLTYLSHQDDLQGVIVESRKRNVPRPPTFYLGDPTVPVYRFSSSDKPDTNTEPIPAERPFPNYAIFLSQKNLTERMQHFEQVHDCHLELQEVIAPSFIDDVLYRLNPGRNVNQTTYIYRIYRDPTYKSVDEKQ